MQIQSILLTVIAIAALYLSGCHTIDTPFPTAEQIATAEYGAPLTIDWQEAVKAMGLQKPGRPIVSSIHIQKTTAERVHPYILKHDVRLIMSL